MIKPPSLHAEYTLIYSGDPALSLPEDLEERARVLAEARETGKWDALIHGEEQPTLFTVRPLKGSEFDWWAGEVSRRKLVESEAAALALRLSLRKVDNFGSHRVEFVQVEGHSLARTGIIDAIYSEAGGEGRGIVLELATAVIERAQTAPRPKS
jgi:hypothetical protein